MLLYAVYTPAKIDNRHREKVFAFASIESFTHAMKEYNKDGAILMPVEYDDIKNAGIVTLLTYDKNKMKCIEAGNVFPSWNSMRDSCDGKQIEIHLVEKTADEKIVKDVRYP